MSPLLIWMPEYTVNNEELDSHHQNMFHILNSVYENIMNSLEEDCILPTIDELSILSTCHMTAEEKYMKEMCDPDIDDHIAKHREFAHKIETLRIKCHDNNLETTKELIAVLGNWLLRHVINDDWKYSLL